MPPQGPKLRAWFAMPPNTIIMCQMSATRIDSARSAVWKLFKVNQGRNNAKWARLVAYKLWYKIRLRKGLRRIYRKNEFLDFNYEWLKWNWWFFLFMKKRWYVFAIFYRETCQFISLRWSKTGNCYFKFFICYLCIFICIMHVMP